MTLPDLYVWNMSKYSSHFNKRSAPKQKLLTGNSLQRELSKHLNIPFVNESAQMKFKAKRDFSCLSRFAKGTKVRVFFTVSRQPGDYHGKEGTVRIEKSKGLIRRYVEMPDGQCFGENKANSILFMTDKEYTIYSVMES